MQTESSQTDSSTTESWKSIHLQLVSLARARARDDYELGALLLAALRERVPSRLGYGGMLEYAERLFGLSPRQTGERLRVASTLARLPATAEALREGRISWSVARELSRVAIESTEAEWLRAAERRSVRELECMVSGRLPGDKPGAPARAGRERRILRFEVRSDTAALFREAAEAIRREVGGALDDDALLAEMARRILGGPTDAGRASSLVHLQGRALCPLSEALVEPRRRRQSA